ncbi:hypothetical protein FPOAC1_011196 [Fusarium poae]|uniref:hypothetical protein n=1 Tax=Fusarium poae TaxID=36050 RepID=UPI001CEA3FB6|nr:hypothetical protein FPOAC1_011196 [Fusarium poae]KAG8666389.1 hypothetical protein FPOAC1_011196 [Fusarium poae]
MSITSNTQVYSELRDLRLLYTSKSPRTLPILHIQIRMPRVIFNFHDGPFGGSGGRGGGFRGRCDYRGKYVYGQPEEGDTATQQQLADLEARMDNIEAHILAPAPTPK